MKVKDGLFDLVVVFHRHSWVNVEREIYRLQPEDDLQVRVGSDSPVSQIHINRVSKPEGEDQYVSIIVEAGVVSSIDERALVLRGFVRDPSEAPSIGQRRYVPRLVVLTRQGFGWEE